MSISLSFAGRYNAGGFNTSRAEIVATDGVNKNRLYVVNGDQNRIDILDIANPAAPTLLNSVTLTAPAALPPALTVNSVAGFNGLLAAAVSLAPAAGQNATSGAVIFFTPDGTVLRSIEVGAGPDMITFSPNGRKVLTANEAEPHSSTVDPEGSISVIDLPAFIGAADVAAAVAGATVANVGFGGLTTAQQTAALGQGLKIQPGKTFAQDLEPEYIAVSADGTRAFVTLQENNGLAIVDLTNNSLNGVVGLRSINFNVSPQFQADFSDRDGAGGAGAINIRNAPVQGLFQPDAIETFQANGRTFLITANEGDSREWTGGLFTTPIVEGVRVNSSSYVLNPANFTTPNDPTTLKADAALGRLNVTTFAGNTDGNAANGFEQIVMGGSRSFSIWDTAGNLIWDSGKFAEQLVAQRFAANFNATHTSNALDNRSDDKGPEPESVEVGVIKGVPYAFVGFERIGGVAVFDLSNPSNPTFLQYINTRDFAVTPAAGVGGDLGPEGITFISAAQSPTGQPLLAVANEVSNTTALFTINEPASAPQGAAAGTFRLQILHGSDFEAGLKAVTTDGGGTTARAANFAAIIDKLEDQSPNTIVLAGGDNFLPGPVYSAGGDPSINPTYNYVYNRLFNRPLDANGNAVDINGDTIIDGYTALAASPGRADITLLNIIGIQASALGNHDFDSGPRELSLIARQTYAGPIGPAGDTWVGAQFPYLSRNLDFSADPDTNPAYTNQIRQWDTYRSGPAESIAANTNNNQAKFAPSTIITENGEKIAVIGLTTQILATIASPQAVRVVDVNGNTIPSADDIPILAAQVNAEVARIKAQDGTINKFILTSHLQILNNERTLAPLLNEIDVILSAGSHTLASDSQDPLRPGDVSAAAYPQFFTNASGKQTALVVTAAEYAYVGQLTVDFDANGDIIPAGTTTENSGAFSTDWAGVKRVYGSTDDATVFNEAFAQGTKGYLAQVMIEGANRATGEIANGTVAGATLGVADVIRSKDGNLFGKTDVYLNGLRTDVRTQETNLGNISADANLWYAKFYDPTVTVSLKNGGGIRDSIGSASGAGGATNVTLGPPAANPEANKAQGDISQLDIENSLRFNNGLTLLSVTAQNFERLLEWGVAGSSAGVTQGRFPQISGLEVAYDWSQQAIVFNSTTGAVTTEGQRIRSLALTDANGAVTTKLVENGVFVGNPDQQIRMVTLNFLAGNTSAGQAVFGGDTYPIPVFTIGGTRADLSTQSGFAPPPPTLNPGALPNGATFAAQGTEQDSFAEYMKANFSTTAYNQPDTATTGDTRQFNQTTTAGADRMTGSSLADAMNGFSGNDLIDGRGGDDVLFGGEGLDTINGGVGGDWIDGGAGDDSLVGGAGDDYVDGGEGDDFIVTDRSGAGAANQSDVAVGGAGNDQIYLGGSGKLYALGGAGDDLLFGGDMATGQGDILIGEDGSDTVFGGAGDDVLVGSGFAATGAAVQADVVLGGAGNDLVLQGAFGTGYLSGGDGADTLVGGGGSDTLVFGRGNDVAYGGGGRDFHVFTAADLAAGEIDSIMDFFNGGDAIVFSGVAASSVSFGGAGGFGASVVINVAGGTHAIAVQSATAATLQANTFFL